MLGSMTKQAPKEIQKNGDVQKYDAALDDGIETSPVVKVIEMIATSTESFDDAIAKGVATAARSLRHISGADVRHMTVAVRNGKVSQYRVDLKVAFALEEDKDEEDDDTDREDEDSED
ncbi:MAG TPA: dodecin family protein [Candidatus Limnocylindria bacterium]|nr:dodecin family protein [Candidatus Limnocylindria bacterium]